MNELNLIASLLVGAVAISNVILTLHRDTRKASRSAFEEMKALKEEYQQKSEELERKVDALMAKITQLEERAWRLEQENFQLRLEISRLKGADDTRKYC